MVSLNFPHLLMGEAIHTRTSLGRVTDTGTAQGHSRDLIVKEAPSRMTLVTVTDTTISQSHSRDAVVQEAPSQTTSIHVGDINPPQSLSHGAITEEPPSQMTTTATTSTRISLRVAQTITIEGTHLGPKRVFVVDSSRFGGHPGQAHTQGAGVISREMRYTKGSHAAEVDLPLGCPPQRGIGTVRLGICPCTIRVTYLVPIMLD